MKEVEIQICHLELSNFFFKYELYLEVLSWVQLHFDHLAHWFLCLQLPSISDGWDFGKFRDSNCAATIFLLYLAATHSM